MIPKLNTSAFSVYVWIVITSGASNGNGENFPQENSPAFDGLPELQRVLGDRKMEFVTTVTEKLLTYALGRGIEYYDRPAIRAIVREAAMDDYRWSSLILGITRSLPFQMRRSESS